MYIYKKSEVSLDEFRLRRFFRDFSSDLHPTKQRPYIRTRSNIKDYSASPQGVRHLNRLHKGILRRVRQEYRIPSYFFAFLVQVMPPVNFFFHLFESLNNFQIKFKTRDTLKSKRRKRSLKSKVPCFIWSCFPNVSCRALHQCSIRCNVCIRRGIKINTVVRA